VSVSFLQPTREPPAVVRDQEPEDATRRDRPVRVLLLNDDFTPAEYVVKVLEQEFGLGAGRATWIMLKAHVTGRAVVGQYPREDAEVKVQAAQQRARADGWPLQFSIEEDD
jgi:ATP-dependent Clp protease adaptor protein ClpS